MAEPTDPVAAAQQAVQAFQDNHDAFIAQFQPATEALDPGWKAKAEGEYQKQLSTLQHEADYQQTQAAKSAAPNRLTTAPTSGSQADVANNLAQERIDSANQNAQERIDLAKEQAASLGKIRQAQLEGKDVTAALNQAKFDFAQKVAQAKADQAAAAAQAKVDAATALANQRIEDNANTNLTNAVKNEDDAQNTAQGQAVTQADSRNATAATLMDAAQKNANDAAQHGSIVAGSVLNNTLAGAPAFAASMGGAPVNVQAPSPMLTQDQKVQIGQALLAGATKQQVLPQVAAAHNGNLAVLAGGGPQFTAPGGGPPPTTSGATGAYDAAQDPNSPLYNPNDVAAPQFTAPAVGKYPTLAAAGSGGL